MCAKAVTEKLDAFDGAAFGHFWGLYSAADPSLPQPKATRPELMWLNMRRPGKRVQGLEYLSSSITSGQSILSSKTLSRDVLATSIGNGKCNIYIRMYDKSINSIVFVLSPLHLFKLLDFSRGLETSLRIYSHVHANLTSAKWEEIPSSSDEVGRVYNHHHGDTSHGCPALPALPQPQLHTLAKCASSVCVTFIAMLQGGAGGDTGSAHMGKRDKNSTAFHASMPVESQSLWSHRLQQASSKFHFQRVWKPCCFLKKIGTGKEKLGLSPYLEMPAGCKYLKEALLNQNDF